ncbi:hypothetical protein [Corynebacterium nuruki]|uniref:hypothetical protein n=1 Tax=Corynebacterium nuruki TaxID=1032851 RepID=UPI0039BED5F7
MPHNLRNRFRRPGRPVKSTAGVLPAVAPVHRSMFVAQPVATGRWRSVRRPA